jgi:hypothetical protein
MRRKNHIPGYMKIVRVELSFGSEFTAAWTVLNSPLNVPDPRTTTAPEGGVVREARFSSGLAPPHKITEKRLAARKRATPRNDKYEYMVRCCNRASDIDMLFL